MSLKIVRDEVAGCVSLCLDCNSSLSSFLDVYIEDEMDKSPFKTLDDAETFVEIMKKLLEKIHDFD